MTNPNRHSRRSRPAHGLSLRGWSGCFLALWLAIPLSAEEGETTPPDGEMSMTATTVEPRPAVIAPPAPVLPEVQRQPLLLPGAFPGQQWIFYPARQDARLEETWSVVSEQGEPVLVCRGEPHGYLRTTSLYQDFELGLEWRFPIDEQGNSGVLMFTSGEDRIWPTAVQVQLHQPKTGSVFGSGGAQVDPELESRNLMRPANQWNQLQIASRAGVVTVSINGKEVGNAKVVTPQVGSIGLQSEGSEVHFRHLWIRDLQPVARAADAGQPMSAICPPQCLPMRPGWQPNSPTYGVWNAYPSMTGWSWTPMPTVPAYPAPTARKLSHVAHGNPLAGGDPLFDTGRRPALARAAAREWEVDTARQPVRSARGGRHRR